MTGGHVLFALDDPYIHLALSEQIAAGHHGINSGEAASPSSSMVWPFLLAVFAKVSWQPSAALGLNVAAGLEAAAMLGFAVAEWPGDDGSWAERVRRLLSVVGPFGWFHRYEVYMVLFCAMLVLAMVAERSKMLLSMYVALLVAASYPSLEVTAKIVPAADDIYLQQYQMHRFATEFATGNVAVSDLGMVSYRRRPGQTVLDLLGLGSVDVARQSYRTPAWLDEVTRKHDVKVVMIYQAPWLYPNLPVDWKRLGRVCKQTYVVTVADPCVSYFATPLADAALLQSKFDAFAKTLPAGVSVRAGTP